jgi:hypothetical protein
MCVGQRVIMCVPAAKTNVEPADARAMIINNYNFLVVGPKLDIIYRIGKMPRRSISINKKAPLDPI